MQTRTEHFEAEAADINLYLDDIHFEVASLELEFQNLQAAIQHHNRTGEHITEDEAEEIAFLAENVESLGSEIYRIVHAIIDCIRSRDEEQDEN